MARQEDSLLSSPIERPPAQVTSQLMTIPYYHPTNYPCELHLPQCVASENGVESTATNVSCDGQAVASLRGHVVSCHGQEDEQNEDDNVLPLNSEAEYLIAAADKACNGGIANLTALTSGGSSFRSAALELNVAEHGKPMANLLAAADGSLCRQGVAMCHACPMKETVATVPHRAQSLPNLCSLLGHNMSAPPPVDMLVTSSRANATALVDQKIQEVHLKLSSQTTDQEKDGWGGGSCKRHRFAMAQAQQKPRTLNELASASDHRPSDVASSFGEVYATRFEHPSSAADWSQLNNLSSFVEQMDGKPSRNSLELARQLEHYAALLRANFDDCDSLRRVESQPTMDSPLYDKRCSRRHSPSSNTDSNCSSVTTEAGDSFPSQNPVWVLRSSFRRRKLLEQVKDQRANISEQQNRADQLSPSPSAVDDGEEIEDETDKLLKGEVADDQSRSEGMSNANPLPFQKRNRRRKETIIHEPAVLIEGVLFRARYLGSTQIVCEGPTTKASRMLQAQEAVSCIKAPNGESQPHVEVDLFISIEKIMVLNTDMQRVSETDVRQDIMMDHNLRTISYIADIGDLLVLMARRVSQASPSDREAIRSAPKMICHVFESEEAQFIAQSIGQAFQVAYMEFLRSHGVEEPRYIKEMDYQEVLNSQEIYCDELEMFSSKEMQKDIVIPKRKDEPLGVVVVESGWGSMLPTVVVANMFPEGPAARCKKINIGDHVIALNGISFVGLPLHICQTHIKDVRSLTAVKITIVQTPPVVEVRIKRPDTKYQLGFSVQNGVICSLLRGGIAERGGIRVGHRIIEINGQSVVAVPHEKVVTMLATAVGEIHMKTMRTSMFRLLTGQETPHFL
uniref:Protein lin-10 n=1 Tax=Trichuris muris TaxID=70415 RepID=A0A5S6QAP6_TRIMR